ncbi:recombinase family protein [Paracoccaceae bacterium]|nr:recombinase family protein [Paracoccaceae bacterium]
MSALGKPVVRAAVYTRKSSDEGLDQEFNSLDAQHEACCAYIASQRHEGWKLIKKRFDDGGISGGTLERPALKALLADVESGPIDMIVVYKIDRLTRSLSDFAKLIDCLDAKGCSFVSVTQSFNTSSSMGRLTLNVLLSFAQFEREVTAERIRDKIAASKKKGMWMGGMVPWGFKVHSDPKIQSLEICKERSPDIERVYDLYEELGCLSKVKRALDRLWPDRNWSRGRIHNILINPIYIGKIRHKRDVYEGLHAAIIEQGQFDRVQVQLQARSVIKRGKHPYRGPSAFLVGKVYDETGDRLTPSRSKKSSGRVIRYYYSNRLISGGADPTGWRLRADMLEQLLSEIAETRLTEALTQFRLAPQIKPHALVGAKERLEQLDIKGMLDLITRVDLSETKASIQLDVEKVAVLIKTEISKLDLELLRIEEPVTLRKRTNGTKLTWVGYKGEPNHALIRAIVTAQAWVEEIKAGQPVSDIMQAQKIPEGMIWKRIRLAFLSPKILKAIVDGTTNRELSIKMLTKHDLPRDWSEQEALFLS